MTLNRVRKGFDTLPREVKIIIYSGVAVMITLLVDHLALIDGLAPKMVAAMLGIGANLIAYLILSENNKEK